MVRTVLSIMVLIMITFANNQIHPAAAGLSGAIIGGRSQFSDTVASHGRRIASLFWLRRRFHCLFFDAANGTVASGRRATE